MAALPDRCEVVVVGGGVIGVSVAYHLAEAGIQDVVLLERKELTSGTTWHAAGLVGQLRTSINMTQLARYTSQLYRGLEEETGQATGYRQCGSISISATAERFEELKRSASMAKVFGLEVNVLSVAEIAEKYPLINTDDLFGGIHIPSDGYANAVDITQALAKAAKRRGARIFTDTKVEAILRDGDKVTGLRTAEGEIRSNYVVICGGMWSRDLAASVGVNLPLHACEHYYVLFEGIEGLNPELPVLRDYDACTYYKYDAGKLLVGAFERNIILRDLLAVLGGYVGFGRSVVERAGEHGYDVAVLDLPASLDAHPPPTHYRSLLTPRRLSNSRRRLAPCANTRRP